MRSWPHAGIHFTSWSIGVERRLAQRARAPCRLRPDRRVAVHPDEPLRRREEDDRVVAAPAVRVLMRERLAVPEPAALLERLLDLRVRVEHALAAEELDGVEEVARRPDRRVDLEAVLHAGVEVVGAVARRRVHRAGAGVERDVVAEHAERVARRTADAGSGCPRARSPFIRATGAPNGAADRRRRPLGASASATITARPSTSYAA